MTNTELKAQIDSQVTNKTAQKSITATNVGANTKAVVDYVDQQVPYKIYKAKLSQSGTNNITAVILKNDTGKTFTYTRNSVGSYSFNFSSIYTDLTKVDIYIHLQTGSFVAPQVIIDNLNTLATIESKAWNGTNFVVFDGILQNSTIYIVVND
jgi:hypothetical protein